LSWFDRVKHSFKSFYVVVPPASFYEWEHNGFVPQNTQFEYGDTHEIKTLDRMVFGADCQDGMIATSDSGYHSICDIPIGQIRFLSGNTKSKSDVLIDYKKLIDDFNSGLFLFIEAMKSRGYFLHGEKKKYNLYAIANSDSNKVVINDYGLWEKILQKARLAQISLNNKLILPEMRSNDLTSLHRLTHALIEVDYNIPIDKKKIATIITSYGGEPIARHEKTWRELYQQLDDRANRIATKISKLRELSWIKKVS